MTRPIASYPRSRPSEVTSLPAVPTRISKQDVLWCSCHRHGNTAAALGYSFPGAVTEREG